MEKVSNPVGRPTVMTEEVILKLEHAFSIGCPDLESCLYAGISKASLYKYQDEHPEFADRKAMLKELPTFKARTLVIGSIDNKNIDDAKWYLERKKRDEFSTRSEFKSEIEHGGTIAIKEIIDDIPKAAVLDEK